MSEVDSVYGVVMIEFPPHCPRHSQHTSNFFHMLSVTHHLSLFMDSLKIEANIFFSDENTLIPIFSNS